VVVRLRFCAVFFSEHSEMTVPAEDVEGRKKLAGYMLRAPMSFVSFRTLSSLLNRVISKQVSVSPLPG